MPRVKHFLIWLLVALTLPSCLDPFEPEVEGTPEGYLVVGGFINLNGITTIRLSRAQGVANAAAAAPETKATVTVWDDAGASFALSEQAPGSYSSALLTLSDARKYQVRLRTSAGREYASELVVAKSAPPIDSISWAVENRGVQLYVNSHNPTNNSRYYRWTYAETWEFQSAFRSSIEYVNGTIQERTEDIYRCWGSANSNTLLLSNTVRLSEDVVSEFPLVLLPRNSVKLRYKYSVLVRQYALTPEEYAYWELLKANTESLGGLFDPQPTQLTGNVRCLTDAAEPVIGYIGAGAVTEKRLFIASTELPDIRYETGYGGCRDIDTVLVKDASTAFASPAYLPLYNIYIPQTSILIGYAAATAECTDCRRRGTNVRPDFWQ
ncbi:hypothetical protein GCM10027346_17820 [Hymenobacter seoulensis]